MGEEKLLRGFLEVIDGLYPPKFAMQRIQTFFRSHRFTQSTVRIHTRFSIWEISLLFKVVYKLGIKDSNRKYFWQLILWTLFYNRKFVDKAFFYGMMMYQMSETYKHLRKQAEKQIHSISKN